MMIEPTEKDIGRQVTYVPQYVQKGISKAEIDHGVITQFNDNYVFVRYNNDIHSRATCRDDLEWG